MRIRHSACTPEGPGRRGSIDQNVCTGHKVRLGFRVGREGALSTGDIKPEVGGASLWRPRLSPDSPDRRDFFLLTVPMLVAGGVQCCLLATPPFSMLTACHSDKRGALLQKGCGGHRGCTEVSLSRGSLG